MTICFVNFILLSCSSHDYNLCNQYWILNLPIFFKIFFVIRGCKSALLWGFFLSRYFDFNRKLQHLNFFFNKNKTEIRIDCRHSMMNKILSIFFNSNFFIETNQWLQTLLISWIHIYETLVFWHKSQVVLRGYDSSEQFLDLEIQLLSNSNCHQLALPSVFWGFPSNGSFEFSTLPHWNICLSVSWF